MKISDREVKKRRRELADSCHTKAEVQRLAGVSERSVYRWYRGVMSSKKIAAAHAALTSSRARQGGRRSAETLAAS